MLLGDLLDGVPPDGESVQDRTVGVSRVVVAFVLGFVIALAIDGWWTSRWRRRLSPRCSVPGCQRESSQAVFRVERDGLMRMLEAWPLCEWCAGSVSVIARGSPLRFPTVGVVRSEYQRVAVAVNRILKGELFDLVSYISGWMWRRRTFTLGPINTTPMVRVMWLSPLDAGSYYEARVDGTLCPVTDGMLETPTGAMVEIMVTRPKALVPYRASLALVVGPFFTSAPAGETVEEPTS